MDVPKIPTLHLQLGAPYFYPDPKNATPRMFTTLKLNISIGKKYEICLIFQEQISRKKVLDGMSALVPLS